MKMFRPEANFENADSMPAPEFAGAGAAPSRSWLRIPQKFAAAGLLLSAATGVVAEQTEVDVNHSMEMHQGGSNHLAFVFAATDNTDDTAGTFGLEYEYRLSTRYGIGGVLEYAGGNVDATTLLAVVDVHLWRGLALQTGPGIEFLDEEEGSEEEFVYRFGMMYEFHRGRATFAPQLHYDATPDKDSVVVGVAFGFSF